MRKQTLVVVVLALVFLFGTTFNAYAKGQRGKMMRHSGFGLKMAEKNLFSAGMLLKLKDEIGLSEAQVKKIEKMQYKFQEFKIKSSADAKLIGLQIKSEFNVDKVNRKKVTDLIRKAAAIRTEIQIGRINYMLDVKSVLKKEQIDKIKTLRKERMKRRMARKWRKRGGKQGMGNPR